MGGMAQDSSEINYPTCLLYDPLILKGGRLGRKAHYGRDNIHHVPQHNCLSQVHVGGILRWMAQYGSECI